MSVLKLDPTTRRRAESELGRPIPEPDTPEFEAFVEELGLTRPDLSQELMRSLKVEGVTLPAEEQAQKAARRERLREVGTRLFYHHVYPGDMVVNRKRVMYSVLGAMGVGMLVLFILGGGLSSPAVAVTTEEAGAEGMEGTVDTALVDTELVVADTAVQPLPVSEFSLGPLFATDGEPASFSLPELPEQPEQAPQSEAPALPELLPPAPGPVDPAYAAMPPGGEAGAPDVLGEAMVLWRRTSAEESSGAAEEPPLALVDAPPSSPQAGGLSVFRTSGEAASPAGYANGAQLPPMTLQQTASTPAPARQAAPQASQASVQGSLTLYSRAPQQAAQPQAAPPVQQPVQQPAQAQPAEAQPILGDQGQAALAAAAEPVDVTRALQPGARIPARLVTGIVLVEGTPSAVVAETTGDWCGVKDCPDVTWIGQATLVAGNRVEASFVQAVIGDEVRNVSGIALTPENTPGLTASVRDEAPTAVQDLLRGAAGGASDYLTALTERRRITVGGGGLIGGGNVIIDDTEVPGLETFLAGRSAALFSLPATQSAVLRIAEVPVGTPLLVLYGVGR